MKLDPRLISKIITKVRKHKQRERVDFSTKEKKYLHRFISLSEENVQFFKEFTDPDYIKTLPVTNVLPTHIGMLILKSNAHKRGLLEDISVEEKEEVQQWASVNEGNKQLYDRL